MSAANPDTARRYLPGADVELLRDVPRGRFRHVLFDFDGTISLLREGWQGIMRPVMLEMIAGGDTTTLEMEAEVDEYIEDSTGIQTLIQMQHLVTLVRKYGRVSEDKVLEPAEYKAIYNARLMDPVNARLQRIQSGGASIDDFAVRGSREFVRALAERGMTMYIFSGTDREDVQNEANVLGVAGYFNEIWGALPSLEEYSKEKVLRELIEVHNLEGAEVLIVGDGPVELRTARDHGCVALGVASDESRGHGWDETKRARLLRAGADLLVPDFGESNALLRYLFDQ